MLLELKSTKLKRNNRILFNNLSLKLYKSQIIILKGENGIGKSSILEAIVGNLELELGTIVYGLDKIENIHQIKNKIFYLSHKNCIKENLTVFENISLWSSLFGVQLSDKKILDALEYFDMKKVFDIQINKLSQGQKRKVALTKLIFLKGLLWLLDEPITALDSFSEKQFFELLINHKKLGGAAIISSHTDVNIPNIKKINLEDYKNSIFSPSFESWSSL